MRRIHYCFIGSLKNAFTHQWCLFLSCHDSFMVSFYGILGLHAGSHIRPSRT
ncbi:hypothetical protein BDC45DRAFT_500363 [Circinella umbellata]|nr:hypothetical protein BDC45DRAFT_500363 [Circinella umbellata]